LPPQIGALRANPRYAYFNQQADVLLLDTELASDSW
jgi:hypothetical protein